MEILENIPLAPLTTFRIGGQARYFAEARTEDDIQAALRHARRHELRVVILGGGSNMLVADNGFDGLVIRMAGTRFAYMTYWMLDTARLDSLVADLRALT